MKRHRGASTGIIQTLYIFSLTFSRICRHIEHHRTAYSTFILVYTLTILQIHIVLNYVRRDGIILENGSKSMFFSWLYSVEIRDFCQHEIMLIFAAFSKNIFATFKPLALRSMIFYPYIFI